MKLQIYTLLIIIIIYVLSYFYRNRNILTSYYSIPNTILPEVSYHNGYFPKDLYKIYRINHQPIVIRGGINSYFPKLNVWTSDYLNNKMGDVEVTTRHSTTDIFHFIPRYIDYKKERFGDVINKKNIYAAENNIPNNLKNELYFNDPIKSVLNGIDLGQGNLNQMSMWKNFKSKVINPLHYDPYDNLFLMIDGSKKFILYKPQDRPFLYPKKETDWNEYSTVNIYKKNKEKPYFRYANRIDVDLFKGDILVLPYGWWHQVETKPESCGVSFWYDVKK